MKIKRIAASAFAAGICMTGCGLREIPSESEITEVISETETQPPLSETAVSSVTEPPVSEETVTETVRDLTYPAEFSFYNAEGGTHFDENISSEIEKLTGVKLEPIPVSGDPYDELCVMRDSGTLPDLIFGGEYSVQLADEGFFTPLDDHIADYGENLTGLYGSGIEKLRHSDGKIYTVGTGGALNEGRPIDGVFQVQHRVLKEAGYPEIKTLDDLEKVIKDYLEAHPTNPSGTKNYGMLLCGGPMTQWHITVGSRSNMVLGYPDEGDFFIDDETGEAVYKWTDDRVGKYYKWLNHLYNEGILADDSFSLKYRDYLNKVGNGNVLVLADSYEDFGEAQRSLNNAGLSDRTYFPVAVTADESISDAVIRSGGFGGEWGIGISSSCKDPERAFEFLDVFCTDEVQMLVNRGIEGVNYTVEDNVLTEIVPADSGFVYPFPMAGDGAADSRGIYFMRRIPERDYTYIEKQTLEAYGKECISQMFTPAYAQPVNRFGNLEDYDIPEESELSIIESGLEVYIRTEVTNAIKLPEDEFDAKWDEIQGFIKNGGGEKLGSLMTEMIRGEKEE